MPILDSLLREILVVEDDRQTREQLRQLLERDSALRVTTAADGQEAARLLAERSFSIIITDLRLPIGDGMDLLREVKEQRIPSTVIVTTGDGSIAEAVRAIRMGAYDFLTKPIDFSHLRLVVQRALHERSLQDELAAVRSQLRQQHSFHDVVSKNPHMKGVFQLIDHVAHTNATVLIEGETGTGKEQIASAIHRAYAHRSGPLVFVNCAAMPETLLESELFGHERGAFTGAEGQRKGRFELAQGGTIFLDEVGDLPLGLQSTLLRVLQERKFERVGGSTSIECDVRVVAATNRPLLELVRAGKFREDLFYRLNVVKINLPPLRDRREDIPLLAQHFVEKYTPHDQAPKRIRPEAMEVLLTHAWPGNVRQLENAIERACIVCRGDQIERDHLPKELTTVSPALNITQEIDLSVQLPEVLKQIISDVEQNYIRKALRHTRGNVGRCATVCGLSRRSITSKISTYNLNKNEFKNGRPRKTQSDQAAP